MSSPEFIKRPSEFNAPVDKPVGPQSPLASNENPIQGSLPKTPDIVQPLFTSQQLPIDDIRGARYEEPKAIGQIPPIGGGQEQRRRRRRRPMESEDEPQGVKFANDLFDLQPTHARL